MACCARIGNKKLESQIVAICDHLRLIYAGAISSISPAVQHLKDGRFGPINETDNLLISPQDFRPESPDRNKATSVRENAEA
jgi:hypothetical protein